MTLEKLISEVRKWNTDTIHYEIRLIFIDGEMTWFVEQVLTSPRDWVGPHDDFCDVCKGKGTASLVRFIRDTHPHWHGFRTRLYEYTQNWRNSKTNPRNPNASADWHSKDN